jgi:hypothetical protein
MTLDVVMQPSENDPQSTTLASAGTYFFTDPNGFTNGFAFDHLSTGSDPLQGTEDIHCVFNFLNFRTFSPC